MATSTKLNRDETMPNSPKLNPCSATHPSATPAHFVALLNLCVSRPCYTKAALSLAVPGPSCASPYPDGVQLRFALLNPHSVELSLTHAQRWITPQNPNEPTQN